MMLRVAAGALLAAGNSTIRVLDSTVQSNSVKDYSYQANGGACLVNETATLVLINTSLWNNSADYAGGAVAMESTE
jgi:hypothetical protein